MSFHDLVTYSISRCCSGPKVRERKSVCTVIYILYVENAPKDFLNKAWLTPNLHNVIHKSNFGSLYKMEKSTIRIVFYYNNVNFCVLTYIFKVLREVSRNPMAASKYPKKPSSPLKKPKSSLKKPNSSLQKRNNRL